MQKNSKGYQGTGSTTGPSPAKQPRCCSLGCVDTDAQCQITLLYDYSSPERGWNWTQVQSSDVRKARTVTLVGSTKQPPGHWRGKRKTETSNFLYLYSIIFYTIVHSVMLLNILYNHCHLYMIISAGMERRHSTAQHQGSIKNMTSQDTIRTITELVDGSAGDSATK